MKYEQQMKEDIELYIQEEGVKVTEENCDEMYEKLFDELWVTDSVTGNGSGSYWFNRTAAKEQVFEDAFEHIGGMITEGLCDPDSIVKHIVEQDWEAIDVMVRCYLLGSVLDEVFEEMVHSEA